MWDGAIVAAKLWGTLLARAPAVTGIALTSVAVDAIDAGTVGGAAVLFAIVDVDRARHSCPTWLASAYVAVDAIDADTITAVWCGSTVIDIDVTRNPLPP